MYDTKKKFREYGQIETLAASLCPFILFDSDIEMDPCPKGYFTVYRRKRSNYSRNSYVGLSGFIMPVVNCHDNSLRNTLFTLPHYIRQVLRKDAVRLSRERIQEWLDRRDAGFLQVVRKENFDGLVYFQLTASVFEKLFAYCDYVTMVSDRWPDPARIEKMEPFRWRSYGDFLMWFYGDPWSHNYWSNFSVCLVFDHLAGRRRIEWERNIRPFLRTGLGRLDKFFQPRPEVENTQVTVKLENMEDHGFYQACLDITIANNDLKIIISDDFHFIFFIAWLKAIEFGELPIAFIVYEGAKGKQFLAHATTDSRRVFFQIADEYEHQVYLEAICSREDFVKVFKDAVWKFLQSISDKRYWEANELLEDYWFDEYKHAGDMV